MSVPPFSFFKLLSLCKVIRYVERAFFVSVFIIICNKYAENLLKVFYRSWRKPQKNRKFHHKTSSVNEFYGDFMVILVLQSCLRICQKYLSMH
jgi:hypothetical protein